MTLLRPEHSEEHSDIDGLRRRISELEAELAQLRCDRQKHTPTKPAQSQAEPYISQITTRSFLQAIPDLIIRIDSNPLC